MKKEQLKLMVACLGTDSDSHQIVFAMTEVVAEKVKKKYVRRVEASSIIWRVETEAPNQFPVFLIGPELPGLATLGAREDCGLENRILVISRDQSTVLGRGLPDTGTVAETYLTVSPDVLGFERIILPTSVEGYRGSSSFAHLAAMSIYGKLSENDLAKLFVKMDSLVPPTAREPSVAAVAAT